MSSGQSSQRDPWQKWHDCGLCQSRHRGLGGAAGLLLVRRDISRVDKPVTHVLLRHRSDYFSITGGTWGMPGGALNEGEDERECALRQASEQVGLPLDCTKGRDRSVITWFEHAYFDHGSWSYTTVIANEVKPFFEPTNPQGDKTLTAKWVAIDDVQTLTLHPAFEAAWPDLKSTLKIYGYDHGWP